jgi:hypothetical protein
VNRPSAFGDELRPDGGPVESDDIAAVDRELEWYAAASDVVPPVGLADKVMAAITAEPLPAPIAAATAAARGRRPWAALAALGDLWNVAWTGPRPVAIRATALTLVVLLLVGAVSAGGALAMGAWNAIAPRSAPVVIPSPSPSPTPTLLVQPSPSASSQAQPTERPTSSSMPGPTETHHPEDTHSATETHHPEGTDMGHDGE